MSVQGLRSRRPETLAELLRAHGREIEAVAYLILRDRGLAEDVAMETMLTAFEKAGSIRDETALRAWLLRVATNKAVSSRRSAVRIVDLALVSDHPASGDIATESTERLALLEGVAALPLQMRAAVVLRYYADLSVESVATALGKSPNTIKAQLQTALDRLRLSLDEPTPAAATEARRA
jgi:RNA polymerase sigma factor (sigma-70 family)